MILKEWTCLAHGNFDSFWPKCPAGCEGKIVRRAFRTPPGVTSPQTKGVDGTLRQLAAEYGLSDMNNHGGETGVRQPSQSTVDFNEMFAPRNVGVGQGGTLQVGKGIVNADRGSGAAGTAAGYIRDNAAAPIVRSEAGQVMVPVSGGMGIELASPVTKTRLAAPEYKE